MSMQALPRNILVADGERALFLRREGEGEAAHLEVEDRLVEKHAATRDQGTDKPGRRGEPTRAKTTASPRGAIEQTDWHQRDEERFARTVVDRLQQAVRDRKIDRLTVIAPPKMLADLRRHMPPEVADRIDSEIAKDLATATLEHIAKVAAGLPASPT